MIYLDSFRLPSHAEEDRIINIQSHMSNTGYTDNAYPCNIFIRMKLSELDFKEITVLYGSNGSGKSTLLNLIAEKLKLKRVSPFNRSNIFDRYTKSCDFRMSYDENGKFMHIPAESRIISSDDVFDYMLNVRENNTEISSNVKKERDKYNRIKYMQTVKLTSMQDYDMLREQIIARKTSGRQYVYKNIGKELRLNSNGETALKYFYNKLKDDALFLLDEPENSLSPKFQIELAEMIKDMSAYCGCQFIIATHSPFLLALEGAIIYDLDSYPVTLKKWYELENPKIYFEFFNKYKDLFDR